MDHFMKRWALAIAFCVPTVLAYSQTYPVAKAVTGAAKGTSGGSKETREERKMTIADNVAQPDFHAVIQSADQLAPQPRKKPSKRVMRREEALKED